MNSKHILRCLVVVLCAWTATACVDKDFRLDEVSQEVTLFGSEATTLPLGYLNKQMLSEIVDSEDLEGLTMDDEGNYVLSYAGEPESIAIEGVDSHFEIPRTVSTFTTSYPKFDLEDETYSISDVFRVDPLLNGQPILSEQTEIYAGYTIHGLEEGVLDHSMHYEVPSEIANVERVWLAPHEAGAPGARIDVSFNLNGLNAVNGGGVVNLELLAPEGFEMYDSNGALIADNFFKAENVAFAAGQNRLEFFVYIASVKNLNPVENGELYLPIDLEYHVSFDMTTRAGTVWLSDNQPELHVEANLTYQDAEVELNAVTLIEHNAPMNGEMSIEGLPAEVKSIKEVTFSQNSPILLIAEGLEWLDDATADLVMIDATLPDYLILSENQAVGYNPTTHTLTTRLDYLRNGLELNLDALNFAGEGIVPQNGVIDLAFTPDVVARIAQGTKTRLSRLFHEGDMTLTTGIEMANLELLSVSGRVDYRYEENSIIEISGLDEELQITINDPGLSPVIMVNFENPLSINTYVTAELTPKSKGESHPENQIQVTEVEIPAAEIHNGVLQNTQVCLVLADETHRNEYSDAHYTFVPCDIAQLFMGVLPDQIDFKVVLLTNPDEICTLYAAEEYLVTYNYNVDVPLAFDRGFDIHYSDEAEIGKAFEDLAHQEIRVGDVALLADIHTTIPLDFGFDAELLDANGNPTNVQLLLPKEGIKGSSDGKSEALTTLRLGIDLGSDGSLQNLSEVETIRFSLRATNDSRAKAVLNAEQYIYLTLKMELKGGITVDLENIDID